MRLGQVEANETCLAAYRRPQPLTTFGQAIAPHVHAMMDVSDGLLIDAGRMAEASGCELLLRLEAVPLSAALLAVRPDVVDTRLAAASAGDDYQLLFAADGCGRRDPRNRRGARRCGHRDRSCGRGDRAGVDAPCAACRAARSARFHAEAKALQKRRITGLALGFFP